MFVPLGEWGGGHETPEPKRIFFSLWFKMDKKNEKSMNYYCLLGGGGGTRIVYVFPLSSIKYFKNYLRMNLELLAGDPCLVVLHE